MTASKVVQVVSFSAHCRNNITVCTGGGQGGEVVMVDNHSGRQKEFVKLAQFVASSIMGVIEVEFNYEQKKVKLTYLCTKIRCPGRVDHGVKCK